MMEVMRSLRLCAAVAGIVFATACTYNYNNRIERPPAPEPAAAAERCSIVWSGVVPSGWTVRDLRGFVATIPESGCPPVELRVHRSGASVDWNTSLGHDSNDWVVRSALTQYAAIGEAPLRRIHAFAEPAAGNAPGSRTGDGGNNAPGSDRGQIGGTNSPGRTPSSGTPSGDGDPPGTKDPVDPGPEPPDPGPPATPPGPGDIPPQEDGDAGARGGPGGAPPPSPSAWVARNAPPAVLGGGVVYGLVYLNLLGVPGAGRIAPRGAGELVRRRGEGADEAETEDLGPALLPAAAARDHRVRIAWKGFEEPGA